MDDPTPDADLDAMPSAMNDTVISSAATARTGHLHLPFLDGIRAVAALWVLLGHCYLFAFGWQRSASPWGRLLDPLLYMHFGVDIFLVLSGFCLALPVVRHGDGLPVPLRDYFLARAWRILPPYLMTLFLILLVNAFVPLAGWGRHAAGLTGSIPAPVLLSNLFLLQDVFPGTNIINGPFWSIAVEWHLYFVFPLLVPVLRRRGPVGLFAFGTAAAAILTWLRFRYPVLSDAVPATIPEPPYYIALFAMGIVAAALAADPRYRPMGAVLHRRARGAACLSCLPLGAALWTYRIGDGGNVHRFFDHAHIIDPLAGAVTAACLLAMCGLAPRHPWRRFFESRFLVAVGGFSYSLYLVHIPLLAALNRGIEHAGLPAHSAGSVFCVLVAAGVPGCLLFARAFAHAFERRYRRAAGRPAHEPARVHEGA